MAKQEACSPTQALSWLYDPATQIAGLDVRSPGEFREGALPVFRNSPILTDRERHEVGICYKERGPSAAVELGMQLVGPERDRRVAEWSAILHGADVPLVICWRGGLRSQTAAAWLAEAGQVSMRVEGGYKEMRRTLLKELERLPDLVVVSGPTGSGKTKFIESIRVPKLDLEQIACHRGSAFGHRLGKPQPTQATFENLVAGEFFRQAGVSALFLEDESPMIGLACVPLPLMKKMRASPVLRIRMDLEERVGRIYEEYVREPLASGVAKAEIWLHYQRSLDRIKNQLGGVLWGEIRGKIDLAFARGQEEAHRDWIRELLVKYYDKAYEYGFQRHDRKIIFEGSWEECREWTNNSRYV